MVPDKETDLEVMVDSSVKMVSLCMAAGNKKVNSDIGIIRKGSWTIRKDYKGVGL